MNTPISRTITRALALITMLTCIAGCNVVTPIAYAIHGPEKINPTYTLPEHATTVVFVDDPSSKIAQRRLRYAMADTATSQLLEKRVLTDMLEPRGIIAAATKDSHSKRMSITELGKSVGADIVIYAVVTNFSLSPETGSYIPQASLRVKVIDVAEGKRVWPDTEFGFPLEVQIPQLPGLSPDGNAGQLAIEQQLANRAGLGISQLFYRHEIGETVLNRR
ncbi:MAG: hypothetical protein P1U30_00870 [Phycisphaerales bacterium]|nr:hypothetical protein [Phycisphaerales bacterium]